MCGPPCAPMLSSLFSGGAPKNVQLGFELSTYISRVGVSDRTDPYAAHDAALTAELESGVSLRAHVGRVLARAARAVRDWPRRPTARRPCGLYRYAPSPRGLCAPSASHGAARAVAPWELFRSMGR